MVLALCKGRSIFHIAFSYASELNYSDDGSRFFDRCYDPSKSLLHFLAWRLPRSSLARANDQHCSSTSSMHLDCGWPWTSVSNHMCHLVISRVSRDMRLFLTSGFLSVPGTYDCIRDFEKEIVSRFFFFAPLTRRELPPGLVEPHRQSQVQWTPAGVGYGSLSRTRFHDDL